MSKYIKLEDAIEQVKTEFYGGGYQEWLEISIDNLINRIANLPTIEVSEDCISKAYLEQEIENQIMPAIDREMYWRGWNNALCKVVELIEDAPSVVPTGYNLQPVEDCISRAEGEWVNTERLADIGVYRRAYKCSNCHCVMGDIWNYCPNCGAKMKG